MRLIDQLRAEKEERDLALKTAAEEAEREAKRLADERWPKEREKFLASLPELIREEALTELYHRQCHTVSISMTCEDRLWPVLEEWCAKEGFDVKLEAGWSEPHSDPDSGERFGGHFSYARITWQ